MQLKRSNSLVVGSLLLGALFGFAGGANAVPYGFSGVVGSSVDIATGEAQFSVDVTAVGTTGVSFLFANSGLDTSVSIAQIYFQEFTPPALSSMGFVYYPGDGVSFHQGAQPGSLPGGNTISFVTAESAGADSPAPQNGINSDESLGIVFTVINGYTFDNIITGLNSGTFRIGLHAISFAADGGSAAFATGGGGDDTTVPEPATMLLFGTGLLGFAGSFRKYVR